MTNEIDVDVNGEQDVTDMLEDIADQAEETERVITNSMGSSEEAFDTAARGSGRLGKGLDLLSGAAGSTGEAIGSLGDGLDAINTIQNQAADRAAELKRKELDVEQAMADVAQTAGDLRQAQLDLNQSVIDGKQTQIDFEQSLIDKNQAMLDAEEAQKAYNDAVKEHGPSSAEAKQAAIDLSQAQADLKQANLDSEQALADQAQATEDGKQATMDATQATIDAKGAQLDLTEAQRAAAPPTTVQSWAQTLSTIAPILMGVTAAIDLMILANSLLTAEIVKNTAAQVGQKIAATAGAAASGIATAAQWLWNIALLASPLTWIILAVIALIAVIVLIATKTTWFQQIWEVVWNAIKVAAEFVWKYISDLAIATCNGIVKGVLWLRDAVVGAFRWVVDMVVANFQAIISLPGKVISAFSSIANSIMSPFRTAFNAIAGFWNSTVGRLSFTIPSWVPGIGGNGWSVPNIPRLATGGRIQSSGLAYVHKGEQIVPAGTRGLSSMVANGSGGGAVGGLTFDFTGVSDSALGQLIMKLFRDGYITVSAKNVTS